MIMLAGLALFVLPEVSSAAPQRLHVEVQSQITTSCAPDDGPAVLILLTVKAAGPVWTLRAMFDDEAYQALYEGKRFVSVKAMDLALIRDGKAAYTDGRVELDDKPTMTEGAQWSGTIYWTESGRELALPFSGKFRSIHEICG